MNPNRIAARPTVYAGTRFRSRLEARWAAFFDLAGWAWEYEPVDLQGWSPDFYLRGDGKPVPIEVKPIDWPGSRDADPLEQIVLERTDLAKVRAVVGVEVLILGSYLPTFDAGMDGVPLGLMYETGKDDGGARVEQVDVALLFKGAGRALDFSVEFGSWHLRIGKGSGKGDLKAVDPLEVQRLWREAGNAVQWRGR